MLLVASYFMQLHRQFEQEVQELCLDDIVINYPWPTPKIHAAATMVQCCFRYASIAFSLSTRHLLLLLDVRSRSASMRFSSGRVNTTGIITSRRSLTIEDRVRTKNNGLFV